MGGHRPHAISSTDEYLSLVLDELQGIRGLLDERLPAPPAGPKLAAEPSARVAYIPTLPDPDAVPVDIAEPAPAAPTRKRAAKKAAPIPAKTTPEE